jgi:hypothetical protein
MSDVMRRGSGGMTDGFGDSDSRRKVLAASLDHPFWRLSNRINEVTGVNFMVFELV